LPEQRFFWALIEGFLSINLGEVEEKGSFKGVFGFKNKKCGQKKTMDNHQGLRGKPWAKK
jgi:hypothetical protein